MRQAPDIHPVRIGGREAGPGGRCFIIAEAGVNHNGDLDTALKMVDTAAECGADAVKFQTFKADELVTTSAQPAEYQRRSSSTPGETQYQMLKRLELPFTAFETLMGRCLEKGVEFLSTPFDVGSADFLDRAGVRAFKISSGDLTDLALIGHVARMGKPMIISTGMAGMEEVRAAVGAVRGAGNSDIILLHCVSAYPALPESVNLRAMLALAETFHTPAGYSDHTLGVEVAIAAAALGACVIEKHFTLDRRMPGPDNQASAEPHELAALVKAVRNVEAAMGDGCKRPAASERSAAEAARKSLVLSRSLPAGHALREGDVVVRRPGTGLPPAKLSEVMGRKLAADCEAGTPLRSDILI